MEMAIKPTLLMTILDRKWVRQILPSPDITVSYTYIHFN
jgi:hypothetical protein